MATPPRRALIEGIELEAPEHREADELPAIAHVLPHDIHVDRDTHSDGALAAHALHIFQ